MFCAKVFVCTVALILLAISLDKTECGFFNDLTCSASLATDRSCFNKYDGAGIKTNQIHEEQWDNCCRFAYIRQCYQDLAEDKCKDEAQAVVTAILQGVNLVVTQTQCQGYEYGTPSCFGWYVLHTPWLLILIPILGIVSLCCLCYCCCRCCCSSQPKVNDPPYLVLPTVQQYPMPATSYPAVPYQNTTMMNAPTNMKDYC